MSVGIENQTPYPFSYCYSYQIALNSVKEHGFLRPWSGKRIHQLALPSYIYLKYGHHSQNDTRHRSDLNREYNGIHHPTFYIRECGSNRSSLQLTCNWGGASPTCQNYGKQEEDRKEMERKRIQEEERRRQQQIERERRIQEEIKKESKALEEKQAQFNKELEMRRNRKMQRQKQTNILCHMVEDDALPIQITEVKDVEETFSKLLTMHGILEDGIMKNKSLAERINTLQYKMIQVYALKKCLPLQAFHNLDHVFHYENLSLTEHVRLLKALIEVTMTDATTEDTLISSGETPMEEKTVFLLHIVEKLYQDSKTTAGNIVLNMIQEFSDVCKEQLSLILFNGIWNPVKALTFYLEACKAGTSQENIEKILHQVKTFQLGLDMPIDVLKKKEPLKYLNTKMETDKDVKTLIQEMRQLSHPENVLNFLENVLEKLMSDLPKYAQKDLDANMKNEAIQMIRDFDLTNPSVEVMVKILIILSVAVEDTTSVSSEDHTKIVGGYFPRATQFASIISLLLSNSQDVKGCLLEIGTGEGKSCIVALFAMMHAIRGKTVDIITSSPVLARRDAEEWSELYKKFDITCSVIPPANLDVAADSKDPTAVICKAYNSHIVYGTVEDFAADILRQEFERQKTRNKRKFDVAIIDEVDYMTLDNGVQITFLSHDATGMRHLDQLLTAIWAKLHKCQRIMAESGEVYWTPGIQYFHKLATDAVFGQETTEHFSSIHILEFGVQLGLLSEEELKEVKVETSSEISDLQQTELEKLIVKFGPQQEKDLLKVFGKVLEDSVQFKFYELKDDKASFIETSCDSGEPISVLLLPQGQACVLMTIKQLVNATIEELSLKIKYSDDYRPKDITDKENEGVILIPKHLKEYTKNRLPVFVENALQAIMMETGREYTIDSRDKSSSPEHHSIIPIDFKSTGVLEKNKRWGDGLQQFLELKHRLALSQISCVTNFMSNFHFFQRYLSGSGIYGVSGTLGEEADFTFLKKHFNTHCYPMPTHRYTKRLELPVLQVFGGREAWIKEICMLVEKQTSPRCGTKGQCVLVICEDVKTAEKVQRQLINLRAISNPGKITMYTRSDKHNVEEKKFHSGEVILATNLGGRGTDFKVTEDVNESGGLSVILTHFPSNRRVEKQIFGRTSRKGNPGMVQMVLNQNDLAASYQGQTVEEMRKLRENYEKGRIADMENDELLEVNIHHELFTLFCQHLKKFDSNYSEEEKQESNISQQSVKETSKMDYHPALNSLKETWALWLTTHEDDINDHKDLGPLKDNLSLILEAKSENLLQGRSENFYDYVKAAVDRTCLHSNDKNNDYGALSCWDKMEKADNMYRAISLYNRAFITINMAKDDYKQNSITLLREAKAALDIYASEICNINVFGNLTQCSRFEQHNQESNFDLQKQTKMQLLNSWKNYIENSVKKLEDLNREGKDADTELTSVFTLSTTEHSSKVEQDEMYLLYDYGLAFVYEVKKKPKFCLDALICFFLGVVQVLAGILICALTCGAASKIGLGLISEGVSDMVSGVEGMIKGTFDWAQWAISKAISIGMSLLTAGLNHIFKGAKKILSITTNLLDGIQKFSSLANDAIQSGKISGLKSTTPSAIKDTVTISFKGLATNSAAKKVMLEGAKFAGKELVNQGSKALNVVIDAAFKEALKNIFEKCLLNKIHTSVKNNKDLEEGLINFIVTQVVPEAAKDQSKDYVIPLKNKELNKDSMKKLSQSAAEDVFSHHETYNEIRSHLDTTTNFIIQILETQVSSSSLEKVKLCTCISNAGLEIADLVKSVPIEPIINEKLIPHIISDMSKSSSSVKDARSEFKEVLKLKEEMRDLVSEDVSRTVIGLLVDQVSSLVQTTWEIPYVKKNVTKIQDKAVEWFEKTPQTYFHINQNIYVHKNGEQDTRIKPEEAQSHITKILMDEDQSLDLELNVLTKSDLIQGRRVKMISVKEDVTTVSTEYYPGKNSSSETIVLQMKSSHTGQLMFRAVNSEGQSRWSGLYDVISQASGGKIEGDVIQTSIHNVIRENSEEYRPQINREIQRQIWRDMATHYAIPE
ncbi:uncharacterized protein LOC120924686 [Rana temporaria]|uniref:uncharacterized protein LOC120924686 n=1 Tax=Rana temporaria TaxID=8407 RepID=UPI001AACC9C4|nr:uncharacterized protein LOC120924686 [Rana temporaria]